MARQLTNTSIDALAVAYYHNGTNFPQGRFFVMTPHTNCVISEGKWHVLSLYFEGYKSEKDARKREKNL